MLAEAEPDGTIEKVRKRNKCIAQKEEKLYNKTIIFDCNYKGGFANGKICC